MGGVGTGEGCWGAGWGNFTGGGKRGALAFGMDCQLRAGVQGHHWDKIAALLTTYSSQALGWGISDPCHNPVKGPSHQPSLWIGKLRL